MSWITGVFIYQVFMTEVYAHGLWGKRFETAEYPRALCAGLLALSAGAALFFILRKPLADRRSSVAMRSGGIALYLLTLFAMVSASAAGFFLSARCINGVCMGFWGGAICEEKLIPKSFDKFLGLMTGGGFFIGFSGLALSCRFLSVGFSIVTGFCILAYLCFRPSKAQSQYTGPFPREDLRYIRRYDPRVHGALLMLFLMSNSLLVIWCVRNRAECYPAEAYPICYAVYGTGMLAGGLLRDKMTKLLTLLLPAAVGLLMPAALLIYGGGDSGRMGVLVSIAFQGMGFCFIFCDIIELTKLHGISKKTEAALLICGLLLPGLLTELAFVLASLVDGLMIFVLYAVLATAFMMLWFSCLILKGDGEEKPPLPFDIRLSAFCERYSLSVREGEVLKTVIPSTKNLRELADGLFISSRTLEKHMANIYKKTSARNRSDLVRMFYAKETDEAEKPD